MFERWSHEPQTERLALELLKPYERRGLIVAADTAGLTRMSKDHPLPRVLRWLHKPKERLHRIATGLGGRAIGRWFADNSCTLFDAPVDELAALTAMAAVHRDGPARIGIAAHSGTFWEIDDHLHGPDAAVALALAEHHCRGGETRVTEALHSLLPVADGLLWGGPQPSPLGPTRTCTYVGPTITGRGTPDYPLPYDTDVHAHLVGLDRDEHSLEAFDDRYRRHRVAMVIHHEQGPPSSAAETLDQIVANARFRAVAARILATPERKLWQGLAVATFPDVDQAIRAARGLMAACAAEGLQISIGIDEGPVYLFPMQPDHEFAGAPVNRASKLAEDLGEVGRIAVTQRLGRHWGGEVRSWSVSGVDLAIHLVD